MDEILIWDQRIKFVLYLRKKEDTEIYQDIQITDNVHIRMFGDWLYLLGLDWVMGGKFLPWWTCVVVAAHFFRISIFFSPFH